MDKTDPVPVSDLPEGAETATSQEIPRQGQGQMVPARSESEPLPEDPPEDPGEYGWVPV